jgi:hypothetical protein
MQRLLVQSGLEVFDFVLILKSAGMFVMFSFTPLTRQDFLQSL